MVVLSLAYWIAFGPHGPRAVAPPGEGWRVFWGTMAGLGISVVIFVIIRLFARDPPSTMTKEYQEMTNEYLRVCTFADALKNSFSEAKLTTPSSRDKTPNPSAVSHLRVTRARGRYKVHQREKSRTSGWTDLYFTGFATISSAQRDLAL